jgi:hypothetical protein
MFSNVAHFTLDLSNNKLETLPADVLYENASNWEHTGTQILKGNNFFHFLLLSWVIFIISLCFQCVTNTQAYRRKSGNEGKKFNFTGWATRGKFINILEVALKYIEQFFCSKCVTILEKAAHKL